MAVDVDIEEGIAVVTMNRPQALNAFNSEQLDLLGAAFHALGSGSLRPGRHPHRRR